MNVKKSILQNDTVAYIPTTKAAFILYEKSKFSCARHPIVVQQILIFLCTLIYY